MVETIQIEITKLKDMGVHSKLLELVNPHYANDLLVGRLHYGFFATC